jgi:hypothetical protein
MAMQDFGGLLFGQGGTGLEDYLTPQQTQAIQQQGMLQAAAALLQAGGPSARPTSLGQALGGALQAGQQGYAQAQQGAIANLMAGQKLREAKIAADLQKQVAETFAGAPTLAEGQKPEDVKFGQYMKLADMYAAVGKTEEAKRFQDMAYQIKPRAEVTGTPFEVTGADNKPLLVQQMKDGSIRTVEGYGPKRDVVLQSLGGRTIAIDKSKLTGGESFAQTLAPQVVGGAETGYYIVGGGGGGGGVTPAPAAPSVGGGQPPAAKPPLGSTIMRPNYVPPSATAGQVVAPAGQVPPVQGLQPIIAGTGTKPQEAFMKASKQLNDLEGALADYKTELGKNIAVFPTNIPVPFSDTGIPLPTGADTARLSGKYNSLLMGVKNLYELGALTGPDMQIINRQFTNPASFTGALTSRNAMNEQITVLEDMLTRAKENLSSSYRQTVPAASTAGTPKELVWDPVLQKAVPKK